MKVGTQSLATLEQHDLVKGAFADRMLAPAALNVGFRPIFGTHDERMIDPIRLTARERG